MTGAPRLRASVNLKFTIISPKPIVAFAYPCTTVASSSIVAIFRHAAFTIAPATSTSSLLPVICIALLTWTHRRLSDNKSLFLLALCAACTARPATLAVSAGLITSGGRQLKVLMLPTVVAHTLILRVWFPCCATRAMPAIDLRKRGEAGGTGRISYSADIARDLTFCTRKSLETLAYIVVRLIECLLTSALATARICRAGVLSVGASWSFESGLACATLSGVA
jgi:hypothetical protein